MSPIHVEMAGGERIFRRVLLDFTGTLSLDGRLLPGVADRMVELSRETKIMVLTADTMGTARKELRELPVEVRLISHGEEKSRILLDLGAQETIAIGNGQNDIPMVKASGLGIAVVGPEGAAPGLLEVSSVVVGDIRDALDLLAHPLRLKATLRE